MQNDKVWLITGAGRGMGLDFAKVALAEGYRVVATGRNTEKIAEAIGESENLLVVKLDVTRQSEADAAAKAALDRFGRIDVLVNNAGVFYAGFFEELTPDQIRRQLDINLMGPMNVARAVLPIMRKQKSGHIISISSTAGIRGYEYGSAYAASKFGLEGWMESLQLDIAPFGIKTTIVEPGFFRTELLSNDSMFFGERRIEDYAERNEKMKPFWGQMNGNQAGDPVKLAKALIAITQMQEPPTRWVAGSDSLEEAEKKVKALQEQFNAHREMSTSLAYEEVQAGAMS